MRDPNRIPVILDLLKAHWLKQPDQRLGQIVVNLLSDGCRPTTSQISLHEDEDLKRQLETLNPPNTGTTETFIPLMEPTGTEPLNDPIFAENYKLRRENESLKKGLLAQQEANVTLSSRCVELKAENQNTEAVEQGRIAMECLVDEWCAARKSRRRLRRCQAKAEAGKAMSERWQAQQTQSAVGIDIANMPSIHDKQTHQPTMIPVDAGLLDEVYMVLQRDYRRISYDMKNVETHSVAAWVRDAIMDKGNDECRTLKRLAEQIDSLRLTNF